MAAVVERVGANVPAPDLNGPQVANSVNVAEKYAQEREKRVGRGLRQFVDLRASDKHKSLLDDPWIEPGTPINNVIPNGGHSRFLIVGAGYGGILFAVNLIKAGFSVDDILIVDPAGGFGGTWYWNRYPGLMCDVEAYIYMPMLEDMSYMPKHKYAGGEELRLYAESICQKYGLHERAMFQSRGDRMAWDSELSQWKIQVLQQQKGGDSKKISITANFVILANGLLDSAKLPDMKGSDAFAGQMFHTARWSYDITGGSAADPQLEKLKDKRVGIVGTGASSIQIVPHLAKWSKELYVFQRTPSAVGVRGNHETDPSVWKSEIASKPGWRRERNMNFFQHVCNANSKPPVDLVSDGWSKMPSYSALIGGPDYEVTPENAADHVGRMYALDQPIQESIRARALEIVKDQETARSLQAWYPGWCKRPCFHDDFLPAFNSANVKLVDTNGRGVDSITRNGIVVGDNEYEVDVLIWGTGFLSPGVGTAPARAAIDLRGRDGIELEEKFEEKGVSTLHGVVTRGFPNLFWPGPSQCGVAPNQIFVLETLSEHVAYITSEASRRAGGTPIIEPTEEAEENWSMRVMMGAATFSSVAGCTPSYLNKEGEMDGMPMEQQIKAARGSIWPKGIADYVRELESWRAETSLKGLEVQAAS